MGGFSNQVTLSNLLEDRSHCTDSRLKFICILFVSYELHTKRRFWEPWVDVNQKSTESKNPVTKFCYINNS